MTAKRKIHIFDTTLRDGEQSPGASLTPDEKLKIARQLERLNVDVIEAGFPASSAGEMKAVSMIAETIRKPVVCGLSRVIPRDIDACRIALEKAAKKRLHMFLATSQIHREHKLKKDKKEILIMVRQHIVSAAKDFNRSNFRPKTLPGPSVIFWPRSFVPRSMRARLRSISRTRWGMRSRRNSAI